LKVPDFAAGASWLAGFAGAVLIVVPPYKNILRCL
jgi:hypothetical protein